jgi:hypothetical protein
VNEDEFLEIINKKISKYCLNVCGCLCCKTGWLSVENSKVEKFKMSAILPVIIEEKHSVSFVKLEPSCPCLCGVSCLLYVLKERPFACTRFPFYFRHKHLIIASWCPAVVEGLLKDELAEIELAGFSIVSQ